MTASPDNSTILHITLHKWMSFEVKSCMVGRNKSIIKMFLTSTHYFWLKYKSKIHIIAFSSDKTVLSEIWISREIHTNTVYKQKQFYIYIYAFSRRFYPKRLTIAFRLYIFISTCVPWESNPQPFAQLTQCSTTEPHRNTVLNKYVGGFWCERTSGDGLFYCRKWLVFCPEAMA